MLLGRPIDFTCVLQYFDFVHYVSAFCRTCVHVSMRSVERDRKSNI